MKYQGKLLGVNCSVGDPPMPVTLGASLGVDLPIVSVSAWTWGERAFVGKKGDSRQSLGELLGVDPEIVLHTPTLLRCPECGENLAEASQLLGDVCRTRGLRFVVLATRISGITEIDRAANAGLNRLIVGGDVIRLQDYPRSKNVGKEVLLIHRSFSVLDPESLMSAVSEWCEDNQVEDQDLLLYSVREKTAKAKYLLTYGKTRRCLSCRALSELPRQQFKANISELSVSAAIDAVVSKNQGGESGPMWQRMLSGLAELGAGGLKLSALARDLSTADYYKICMVLLDAFSPNHSIVFFDELEAHIDEARLPKALSFARALAGRGNTCVMYSKSNQVIRLCDVALQITKLGVREIAASSFQENRDRQEVKIVRPPQVVSRSTKKRSIAKRYSWNDFIKSKPLPVFEVLGVDRALAELFSGLPEARARAVPQAHLRRLKGKLPDLNLAYKGLGYQELVSLSIEKFQKHFENLPILAEQMRCLMEFGCAELLLNTEVGSLALWQAQIVRTLGILSDIERSSKRASEVVVEGPLLGVPSVLEHKLLQLLQVRCVEVAQ